MPTRVSAQMNGIVNKVPRKPMFMFTGETVNYEMLTKENLEKVLVKFGGKK